MKAAFLATNELNETLLREEVPRRRAAAIVMSVIVGIESYEKTVEAVGQIREVTRREFRYGWKGWQLWKKTQRREKNARMPTLASCSEARTGGRAVHKLKSPTTLIT